MVLPTMIDRRTTQSSEFVADIREAYPDIAGLQVVSTQNIGDYQEAGSTLFAVDDDELYSLPGKKPSTRTVRRLTSCSRLFDND